MAVERAANRAGVAARHALGVARLVSGRPLEASEILDSALGEWGAEPALLNDLAVAHLEAGDSDDGILHLLHALEALEPLVSSGHPPPEALFNRALVLQRLCLFGVAMDAWATYLQRDGESPWASEARQHLAEAAALAIGASRRGDCARARGRQPATASRAGGGR
jgi:tetratricopeptide (TPR) repeat protein